MVSDVATPEPAHDQVLVRMTNSGICGTDLKIFTGAMPARYPVIMGHEMAGEVLDGADGSRLRRGDRVLVDPVLFCGACFDCRAGRTNLCPNGAVIGREVDGGFADFVVAPRSSRLPAAAVDRQPDGAAHSGVDDGASRPAPSVDCHWPISRRDRAWRLRTIARATGEGPRARAPSSASRAARGSAAWPSGSALISPCQPVTRAFRRSVRRRTGMARTSSLNPPGW